MGARGKDARPTVQTPEARDRRERQARASWRKAAAAARGVQFDGRRVWRLKRRLREMFEDGATDDEIDAACVASGATLSERVQALDEIIAELEAEIAAEGE